MKNVLGILLIFASNMAKAESWKIATLEWPPYMCSQCYKNGAAAEALREALAKKGIAVEFVFTPWVQAQKNGGKRSFVGYFPAWKEEVLPGFKPSTALFNSPVVFMERKAEPLNWSTLKDLKGKTFGVTEGYGNTSEFNNLVKDGSFKTVKVLSEESTIRKLIAGHVDAVLIDLFVGKYYLSKIFSLQKEKVTLGNRILENKSLYFAFNEGSLQKADTLNTAIRKIDFQKRVEDYVTKNTK